MNLYYFDKYYKENYYYLFSMSIYHILIILATLFLSVDFKVKTFMIFSFNPETVDIINFNMDFTFKSMFLLFIILLIDFIFLYIIKKEIEYYEQKNNKIYWFRLTTLRMILIELIILSFTIHNPMSRQIMYFLSLNTMQIFFIYKIIKNVSIGKLLFLTWGYIILLKLIFEIIFYLGRLFIR